MANHKAAAAPYGNGRWELWQGKKIHLILGKQDITASQAQTIKITNRHPDIRKGIYY